MGALIKLPQVSSNHDAETLARVHTRFVQRSAHRQESTVASRVEPGVLWFCFFLLATIGVGLLLRWEMAGASFPWIQNLDLRRAHSHLGFYGVLFPATWIYWNGRKKWVPHGLSLFAYMLLVVTSTLAFLWQGYGLISIAASTGILAIWLSFAWKNRPGRRILQADWSATASLAIVGAAVMIPFVAKTTHHDPALANQLAHAFLTLLLFGAFVPAMLEALGIKAPRAWTWLLATGFSAAYLTELSTHPVFGLGLLFLAASLLRGLFAHGFTRHRGLMTLWALFAASLGSVGLGLFPYSHFEAIAGIHFLVLGPLLMTFATVRLRVRPRAWLEFSYQASLLTMVSAILLQGWLSSAFMQMQKLAAVSGSALVALILITLFAPRWLTRTPNQNGMNSNMI